MSRGEPAILWNSPKYVRYCCCCCCNTTTQAMARDNAAVFRHAHEHTFGGCTQLYTHMLTAHRTTNIPCKRVPNSARMVSRRARAVAHLCQCDVRRSRTRRASATAAATAVTNTDTDALQGQTMNAVRCDAAAHIRRERAVDEKSSPAHLCAPKTKR